MQFALALLATLAVGVSAISINRGKHVQPYPQSDEKWEREVPEIAAPKITVQTYTPGNEYRYLYDGQILTGMPDVHLQFSGARIRAIVKLQNIAGAPDVMQIEKVFVGSLHERFVSDPRTIIQLDAFEPMEEKDAPFEEVLKKPVRFTEENGKIDNFEATLDDPSWSINIKRAILATFHLSLVDKEQPKNEDRLRALSPEPFGVSEKSNEIRGSKQQSGSPSNDENDFFTVVENGIAGRCEVSYLVLEQPNQAEDIFPIYENENETASQNSGQQQRKQGGASSRPGQSGVNVLNVTKTFNYRNCEFQPFVFKGLHLTSTCPGCESDPEYSMDILESAAHTRYNITGTRGNAEYLIDSAITEAVYKVTPRSHFAGSMVAYANITVQLIAAGPMKTPITFPGQGNAIQGLHMINPRFLRKDGEEKFLYESPEADKPIVQMKKYWPNVEEKPRKIKALFEKLVQGMEEKEIKADTAVLVEHITHLMEYATCEEIPQIHEQVKGVSVSGVEKEEIDHLFVDLLVSTGTNCTFQYIKKLIMEKKIKGPVVIDALAALPFRMDIDRINGHTLEEMRTLCQDGGHQDSPFVTRACWLAYGTLVHKACVHHHFTAEGREDDWSGSSSTTDSQKPGSQQQTPQQEQRRQQQQQRQQERQQRQQQQQQTGGSKPTGQMTEQPINPQCPPEVRQQIVETITQKLKAVGSKNDEEKILLIKVIGNMGLPETIDELGVIAQDESEPVYVRTQAIYAMKIMALKYQPMAALEILMPLYRDTTNPTQVRIAAFVVIITSKPDLPVLQHIAQSLNREVDLDVASYVYSSMSSLANATDPCLKNVTRDVLLALELTTPINVEWRHSKHTHYGTYMPQMHAGLFWESNQVMDKDAPAPKSSHFRLHASVNKKSLDLIEFGFETEGWGETLKNQLGNLTTDAIEAVLKGQSPRRPRQAPAGGPSNVPELKDIDSQLQFKPMEDRPIRGTAFFKLFGQETRFVVINPQTISRFIVDLIAQQDAIIPKITGEGYQMDNRRAGMLVDSKVEFPSVLGVPVSFHVRIPVVTGMKGKVKATMVPKPEGGMALFKQIPEKVTVETTVKTHIAAEVHAKLSVYLGFLRIGAGLRTKIAMNLPMTGKIEVNVKDRMSKITMDLPEAPLKLVKTTTYPVTYVMRLSKNSVTYQPKQIPQGLEGTRRQGQPGGSSSEEEKQQKTAGQQQPQLRRKVEGALHLEIEDIETDLITKSGHVHFPKSFNGLPVPIAEIWEIATPAFVKSRDVDFQIGHDSQAFKVNVEMETEMPNTRIAPFLLPVLGAKRELEVTVTPKAGIKKVTMTFFERSEMTVKDEQELINKLKDKVTDITVKPMQNPNLPADYAKIPKVGHSIQILVNGDGSDAPTAWTTRYLMAVLYTVDGRYMRFVGAMDSKVPALAKKISFNAEMRYPDRNGLWFVTPEEATHSNKSIQGQAELMWGDDLTAEKSIKMRMRYQKTQEQTIVEKQDLYNVDGIPVPMEVAGEIREGDALFTSLFEECEEDRKIGAPFSKECVDMAIRYADLLRLKIDIDYKNVSPAIRRTLNRVEAVLKGIFYWNTEVEDVDVKNPENKVNAVIEFSADRSYVDIKYQTPTQNVTMTNLDLPMDVQPASALFPWSYSRWVGLVSPPSCTISGPKINTFDDVSDFMPLSTCYHVMVKDATDDNLFAVLVANVAKGSLAKKVVVLFDGHKIEFVPKNEGNVPNPTVEQPIDVKSLYQVKYNGQVLADALTPEKRTTIPPNTPEDKEEVADVMLIRPESSGNKQEIIGLVSRATGLKVLFDGSSVTVIPSVWWKNHVVGLCGKYDGQTWDEKLLPNKTLVAEPTAFSRAFQLTNTPGCDKEIAPIPEQQQGGAKKNTRQ